MNCPASTALSNGIATAPHAADTNVDAANALTIIPVRSRQAKEIATVVAKTIDARLPSPIVSKFDASAACVRHIVRTLAHGTFNTVARRRIGRILLIVALFTGIGELFATRDISTVDVESWSCDRWQRSCSEHLRAFSCVFSSKEWRNRRRRNEME
mmetsp:Transcript_2641/g.9445  ORF Transcript_2641/g.9445 Transcript_2641/m.9445 type:complete len:156 (-) Transcript_2641:2647-3114(-)